DSLLLATAAYGIAKQATLEQSSELSSVLRTDAGMAASLEEGSELQSRIVLAQRAAAAVEQTSSLSATVRIGAGLNASVYGDSSVSGALGLAVRLSGMVDQAGADMVITGPHSGLPLYATVATSTTTGATLQKQTGLALAASIEQSSDLQ